MGFKVKITWNFKQFTVPTSFLIFCQIHLSQELTNQMLIIFRNFKEKTYLISSFNYARFYYISSSLFINSYLSCLIPPLHPLSHSYPSFIAFLLLPSHSFSLSYSLFIAFLPLPSPSLSLSLSYSPFIEFLTLSSSSFFLTPHFTFSYPYPPPLSLSFSYLTSFYPSLPSLFFLPLIYRFLIPPSLFHISSFSFSYLNLLFFISHPSLFYILTFSFSYINLLFLIPSLLRLILILV